MENLSRLIPLLLGTAVLLPLASFFTTLIFGRFMVNKKAAAIIATAAIVSAGVLSYASLFLWLTQNYPVAAHHGDAHGGAHDSSQHDAHGDAAHGTDAAHGQKAAPAAQGDHGADGASGAQDAHDSPAAHAAHGAPAAHGEHAAHDEHGEKPVVYFSGNIWTLGTFGNLELAISYYVDSLTLVMFCMVTLIASCIHCYAMGYMHDELHDITDKEVTLASGQALHRPGRFHRFFQYLSLFCFSMLGLVLAGNVAMVFCFWELVGICSYFLIGFYIERKSASTAANKAFIVNRVGDFGMIIGLMALWSALGTFNFGDTLDADGHVVKAGMFSLVRPAADHHALKVPDGMFISSAAFEEGEAGDKAREIIVASKTAGETPAQTRARLEKSLPELSQAGYWLLIVAGVGIFCGCVGKSAQFPLHVWLPDAMEGPTPVSALVHSATMVAAGVYLVGRFFPVFAPEVLMVIATIGCITLFVAATIAITANDIKRVLAYSTISQLGYMMLALGVGGWVAGLYHLVTHAFFKSLLFMCSGSVIHAVHTNDMRSMGGLLKKMPVTAITMLIGCLAIAGVGIPFFLGFSGYYSKDAILEQAYSFWGRNHSSWTGIYFVMAAGGAAITSFYMFRMWYMTFVGTPRDQERYDHAHESPALMYGPLVVISPFAIAVAWNPAYLGYILIPIGFLVYQGSKRGWFSGGHDAHGHDAHGHDAHGHDAHGHDAHGHDAHGHDAHGHDAHGHDAHGHDAHGHGGHGHGGGFPFSLGQLVALLVVSLIGGYLVELVLPVSGLTLENLLKQSQPAGLQHADVIAEGRLLEWSWPNEHFSHAPEIKIPVTLLATGTWILGITLATLLYATGTLNPADVRKQFSAAYNFLVNKWWFDELYDRLFVRPTKSISTVVAGWDKNYIDRLLDQLAATTKSFSNLWDRLIDRSLVDGRANWLASVTYRLGLSLRGVQTGKLRQYVMFIVLGAIAVFVLISFFWSTSLAK